MYRSLFAPAEGFRLTAPDTVPQAAAAAAAAARSLDGPWMPALVGFLVLFNLSGLLLMARDKTQARRGGRRIPEKTLFLLAAAGGSAGVLAGIWLFRHKTRHRSFTIGIPALLCFQVIAAVLFVLR